MSLRLSALALTAAAAATLAAPRAAHAGNGVDLVRFMPEDASIYMVVDVAGARDSDLFKKGMAKLVSLAPGGFATVQAAGLDPATAVDTIAFGGRGWEDGGNSDDFVAVAEGKQVQLIADLISRDPKSKATKYHGVTTWGSGDGAIALVKKRMFFAKPSHIERAIDLALGKIKGAAKSPKGASLRAVISATDTRHDLWAAMVMPASANAMAKAQGIELQGVSMGASLSTDLALELKIINTSEASATTMLKELEKALPQLTPMLGNMGLATAAKTLQIDKDGATVRLAMTITQDELKTLATFLGATLGGALGGLNPGGP
jgi:hypothetical protein